MVRLLIWTIGAYKEGARLDSDRLMSLLTDDLRPDRRDLADIVHPQPLNLTSDLKEFQSVGGDDKVLGSNPTVPGVLGSNPTVPEIQDSNPTVLAYKGLSPDLKATYDHIELYDTTSECPNLHQNGTKRKYKLHTTQAFPHSAMIRCLRRRCLADVGGVTIAWGGGPKFGGAVVFLDRLPAILVPF
uniref:Uncharacterized protein n=1 Tax=Branchiostoma floridae TaxID=7739 RepID=C3YX45_BRAFL|eukprot:XP_002599051.1 hypothetical protein BRAFLDRAFT_81710 [Branchiostoma floridae]